MTNPKPHTPRTERRISTAAYAALLLSACSHGAPSPKTAQTGLDVLTDEQRTQTFESTASALDSRPEYVDEFYRIVRKHPETFRRFLANTARDLRERDLSSMTVAEILPYADSYQSMLEVTLDQTNQKPDAADVLAKVMVEKRAEVADMLTNRPAQLTPVTEAILQAGAKKPNARGALREAMEATSGPVAHIIVEDPDTVGKLMKAMLDAGVTRSVLEHSFASVSGK
jgi:hypothetical protein